MISKEEPNLSLFPRPKGSQRLFIHPSVRPSVHPELVFNEESRGLVVQSPVLSLIAIVFYLIESNPRPGIIDSEVGN
jgi:hypothetical protein